MTRAKPSSNLGPVIGLILLSLIPIIAGASRLTVLAGGQSAAHPADARFFDSPIPVIVHIVGATLFCLLGALQFLPRLRRGRPSWHRYAGRIAAPAGLAAALSGLWMTLFYPWPPSDGFALYVMRLVFGSAMAVFLILGFRAVRRRDFSTHSAWMIRGYAIGIGAGTQVLTSIPAMLLVAHPDQTTKAIYMAAGWVLNLAVAEFVIRRSRRRPRTSGRSEASAAAVR